MKINTLLLVISLLFLKAGFTQSNHTITIDGNNNEWSGLETFTNCSSADNAYFTWDADYIYFGIKDAEANYEKLATFMYFDTDPSGSSGSNSAYTWDNNITTPFKADYVIVWKNQYNLDYIEIRKYDAATWSQIASSNSTTLTYNSIEVVKFAIGTGYREVRIKRTLLDNPIAIKFASLTQQDYEPKWRYFAWPSNDWTDKANGAGQSIPNYYGFILKDQISQTNSPYYKADIKSFDGGSGGTATNWATAANWAPDGLPGVNTLTLIPNGKNVNIAASSTADAYDLVVNGSLTIKSGGSLIQNSAVQATVERDIPAWTAVPHGWHFLSSPVTAQAVSPAFTDATPANYDFYKWNEATNYWLTQKDGANGITNFTPGAGYLVAYANTATRQFSGTLNNSDVTIGSLTISAGTNKGWHLLGNPFSSAIAWGTCNRTNINATAKVWNESTAAYIDITSGVIPPMNGFMVQVSSGTGSVTIPTTARVHDATAWYKSGEVAEILLVANDPEGQTAQESKIRLESTASTGFDTEFDSHFLAGYAPQFYSKAEEETLSTNSLPSLSDESVIPFGFVKNDASNFSIELQQNIDGYTPYLKDLKTNTMQNLAENPVYNFTSEAGDDPNRFELSFLAPTGLYKPATQSQLRVYTANGKINISGASEKAELVVRNMIGQVVLRSNINNNAPYSVSTSNLPEGVYVVSILSGSKAESRKVVVKR